MAITLAASGHRVVVNYAANATAADEVVAAITSAGGEAISVQGDVSDEADVAAIFAAVEDASRPASGSGQQCRDHPRRAPPQDESR